MVPTSRSYHIGRQGDRNVCTGSAIGTRFYLSSVYLQRSCVFPTNTRAALETVDRSQTQCPRFPRPEIGQHSPAGFVQLELFLSFLQSERWRCNKPESSPIRSFWVRLKGFSFSPTEPTRVHSDGTLEAMSTVHTQRGSILPSNANFPPYYPLAALLQMLYFNIRFRI